MQRKKNIWVGCFVFSLHAIIFSQTGNVHIHKYWIFFRDKPVSGLMRLTPRESVKELNITQRALDRRKKILGENQLFDEADYPLSRNYIDNLQDLGIDILFGSRWLNAVSALVPNDQLDDIRSLPFISRIQRVGSFRIPPPLQVLPKSFSKQPRGLYQFDYGPSFTQNNIIRVPEIHDLGLDGFGVLIGMIDSGFDYLGRTIFFQMDIIAEHDFVWGDGIVSNEGNEPDNQDDHGTETLSVIGGFHEGNLIGPAFGASYALAKTEWEADETRIEEDQWVAGIEWLEGLGADVVSSSVGYNQFDDFSYSVNDLDGNTCVTTIAADIAARKGVVVVNSAGNERGNFSWKGKILSPADGDDVIAVGAVYQDGSLAAFSSIGPTADGRIKPDVVAMGVNVSMVSASRSAKFDYTAKNGTSYSCPQASGVCALVLEAHPELSPLEVREALRETSDRAASPDTLFGWGLIDAYEAVFYHGMVFTNFQCVSLLKSSDVLEIDILSKTGINQDSVRLYYRYTETDTFETVSMVYQNGMNPYGFRGVFPVEADLENMRIYFTSVDTLGAVHTAPVGAPHVLYDLSRVVIRQPSDPECSFRLYPGRPNPFNPNLQAASIVFDLARETHIKITLYNILGQEIVSLYDGLHPGGENKSCPWDGKDRYGNEVASGVYICQLTTEREKGICKLLLIK